MTIKLKAATVDNMLNHPLLAQVTKKQLPTKTSYALACAVDKLIHEMKTYFTKIQETADKYAVKIDGKTKQLPGGYIDFGDNQDKANEIMTALGDVDIELPLSPIKLDFDQCPDMSIEEISVILPLLAMEK